VKWWFPARYLGLHHKNSELERWKRAAAAGGETVAEWKREQHRRRHDG
jgi:hypothetical protein